MDDEEKLQSEIDLVSGDETVTPTRGATTGTDEGKGADDSGETDNGGTGTVSGSDGDDDSGGSGSVAGYTLYVTANPVAGASNIYVKKAADSGFGSTQIQLIANTQYTLGVTAAQGYTFSGWYLNNSLYSNNTTFNYTPSGRIGADMTFEARFTSSQGGDSGTTSKTPQEVTDLFSTPNAEYAVDITINYPLLNPISNVSVKLNGVTIPVTFANKMTESSTQTIHVIYNYTQPDVIPHEGGLQFEMLFTQNNTQYHKYYGVGSPSVGWEHPVSNGQSDY